MYVLSPSRAHSLGLSSANPLLTVGLFAHKGEQPGERKVPLAARFSARITKKNVPTGQRVAHLERCCVRWFGPFSLADSPVLHHVVRGQVEAGAEQAHDDAVFFRVEHGVSPAHGARHRVVTVFQPHTNKTNLTSPCGGQLWCVQRIWLSPNSI